MGAPTMPAHDVLIPVDGGTLGAMDFGGSGPSVLLVHAPGHCAATWVLLAPILARTHRVVALDLRGHGLSEAPSLAPDEAWIDLATVIEHFDLGPAIVIGHDHGAFLAAHVVTLDGNAVLDAEQSLEQFELAVDPGIAEAMTERFNLGRVAHTTGERDAMIATAVDRYGEDWLLTDADTTALRAEVERSLLPRPDGTWVHTPHVDDLLAYYRFHAGSTIWPQPRLYGMVRQPVLVVHCRQGGSADHYEELVEIVSQHDHVTLRVMEAGHMPHQSAARQTAALIEKFASSLPLPG